MTKTVLIVGATGWLGSQIAARALDEGAKVSLLVRGGVSHPKAASLEGLVARGAKIVDGDLSDFASLQAATRGVSVVISAVQGGPDILIDGQVALARAAKANGVRVMVPSDFAADYRDLTVDQHSFLGLRAEADRQIAAIGIPQINVLNGAFTEMLGEAFMGLIDLEASSVSFWGSEDQPYDFTHTSDAALYTAKAALDIARPPGVLQVVGDTTTPKELAVTLSRLSGRTFTLVPNGTLSELDAAITAAKVAQPDNPMAWVAMQYHRVMASGSGKLHTNEAPKFGGTATTVEVFLRDWLATKPN